MVNQVTPMHWKGFLRKLPIFEQSRARWESHSILLDNNIEKFAQRIQYLHENPVRAGYVTLPQEWKYSSAIDFYTDGKGLIKLTE